jgi:hypothetical protein
MLIKPNYEEIGRRIGETVDEKNSLYGDSINSTAQFLLTLFPNGIHPEAYADVGILVRLYDKMKRVAEGNKGAENAYNDIAGYGILMSREKPLFEQQHPYSGTFSNMETSPMTAENLEAAINRVETEFTPENVGHIFEKMKKQKISEAIASIRSNYPSSGYTMLCEGLDVALDLLEKELANAKRIQHGNPED